jgi:deazaflavin-dependent oxidoreductase (nitroreductase family)
MSLPGTYHQHERGWMTYPKRGWRRAVFRLPVLLWRLGLHRLTPRTFLLLTTTGRKSGQPRRTMLEYSKLRDRFYLSSGWGARTEWYRNVRADPLVTLQSVRDGTFCGRATVVTDNEELAMLYPHMRQSPVWEEYLASWGIADTVEDFVAKKDRLSVLRVDPVDAPTPPPMDADLRWLWVVVGVAVLASAFVVLR